MRKLLLVLSLLVVFFVGTGMKSLKAQWITPLVSWSVNCVYQDDNTIYVVNLTIIDVCADPDEVVFTETKLIETTETDTFFDVDDVLCTIDDHALCFRVVFTVQKRNKTTQAIICSGQKILPTKNCEGLMDLDGPPPTPVSLN